jgi:hypothetical protein
MLRGVYGVKINREFRHTLTHGDVSKIDCPPPLLLLEREALVTQIPEHKHSLSLPNVNNK